MGWDGSFEVLKLFSSNFLNLANSFYNPWKTSQLNYVEIEVQCDIHSVKQEQS